MPLFSFLNDETTPNPHLLPTVGSRINRIADLSLIPCLICFLAFGRSVLYRFFEIGGTFHAVGGSGAQTVTITNNCKKFAWLNNAGFTVKCDHKPLDIHALSAILWLLVFTSQVLLIRFNFRKFHKFIGNFGFCVMAVNIAGMMYLATYDYFNPMPTSARPAAFTPFMWMNAFENLYCTWQSYLAIRKHKPVDHAIWIYRAFVTSFITPVIRFYPLILRYIFGTECARLNRDRLVMGSMTVAKIFVFVLFYKAQVACRKKVWDGFMKAWFYKLLLVFMADFMSALMKGFFFTGMMKCAVVGPKSFADEYGLDERGYPIVRENCGALSNDSVLQNTSSDEVCVRESDSPSHSIKASVMMSLFIGVTVLNAIVVALWKISRGSLKTNFRVNEKGVVRTFPGVAGNIDDLELKASVPKAA